MSLSSPPTFEFDFRHTHRQRLGVCLHCSPVVSCLRFSLPTWTPGSYLIRDYVGQLEEIEAIQAGIPLQLRRTGTSDWQIELPSQDPVEIRYAILAKDLTVRTCHLNAEHGFLALAAVAMELEGERWSPHRVRMRLPEGWHPFVPLPPDPDGGWTARDYDHLIDTPIEVGPHLCHQFAVAGVPHRWVSWGSTLLGGDPVQGDGGWLTDVESVCLACCRLMGVERPAAQDYLFVLHLNDNGYGGLEHDSSTVLQYGRRRLAQPDGRRKLLQLVAHEYLHQWNVRRLRPAELSPYDYSRAVVIPTLWFAEGITSYLDQLLPHAAGLCSEVEVLQDIGADLSRYLLVPGRSVQSLRQSSEEAWVKLYRADAHASNNQISYYLKGAVIALVLDLHLRRSGSALGLVLQDLWRRFGAVGRGYREQDLVNAFAAAAPDLETLLPQWLQGFDDPPLASYLSDVGLDLIPVPSSRLWVGWHLEITAKGLTLQRLVRDSPAQRAGLQVGDELLALNGWRLGKAEDLEPLLSAGLQPAPQTVLFARDGLVRTAELLPEPPATDHWSLEINPSAPSAASGRRRRWLGLELS